MENGAVKDEGSEPKQIGINHIQDPNMIAQVLSGWRQKIEKKADEEPKDKYSKKDYANIAVVLNCEMKAEEIIDNLLAIRNSLNPDPHAEENSSNTNSQAKILQDNLKLFIPVLKSDPQAEEKLWHNLKLFIPELIRGDPGQTNFGDINNYLIAQKNGTPQPVPENATLMNKFRELINNNEDPSKNRKDPPEIQKAIRSVCDEACKAAIIVKENALLDPHKLPVKGTTEKLDVDQYFAQDLAKKSVKQNEGSPFDVNAKKVADDLKDCYMVELLKLKPEEFNDQAWAKERGVSKSTNMRNLIAHTNNMSDMVVTDILKGETPAQRQNIYNFYVKVLDKCIENKDYGSAMAILGGLQKPAIRRLKGPNGNSLEAAAMASGLGKKYQKDQALLSPTKNFGALRAAVINAEGPVTPYLGANLQDLTFIDDGNPDFVKLETLGEKTEAKAIEKRAQTGDVITMYQGFQNKAAQHFRNEQGIERKSNLGSRVNQFFPSENESYTRSLQVNPRETNDSPKPSRKAEPLQIDYVKQGANKKIAELTQNDEIKKMTEGLRNSGRELIANSSLNDLKAKREETQRLLIVASNTLPKYEKLLVDGKGHLDAPKLNELIFSLKKEMRAAQAAVEFSRKEVAQPTQPVAPIDEAKTEARLEVPDVQPAVTASNNNQPIPDTEQQRQRAPSSPPPTLNDDEPAMVEVPIEPVAPKVAVTPVVPEDHLAKVVDRLMKKDVGFKVQDLLRKLSAIEKSKDGNKDEALKAVLMENANSNADPAAKRFAQMALIQEFNIVDNKILGIKDEDVDKNVRWDSSPEAKVISALQEKRDDIQMENRAKPTPIVVPYTPYKPILGSDEINIDELHAEIFGKPEAEASANLKEKSPPPVPDSRQQVKEDNFKRKSFAQPMPGDKSRKERMAELKGTEPNQAVLNSGVAQAKVQQKITGTGDRPPRPMRGAALGLKVAPAEQNRQMPPPTSSDVIQELNKRMQTNQPVVPVRKTKPDAKAPSMPPQQFGKSIATKPGGNNIDLGPPYTTMLPGFSARTSQAQASKAVAPKTEQVIAPAQADPKIILGELKKEFNALKEGLIKQYKANYPNESNMAGYNVSSGLANLQRVINNVSNKKPLELSHIQDALNECKNKDIISTKVRESPEHIGNVNQREINVNKNPYQEKHWEHFVENLSKLEASIKAEPAKPSFNNPKK